MVAREDGGARGAGSPKRSGFRANTARPLSGFREHGKAGGRVLQRGLFWGRRALYLADVSPWSIRSVVAWLECIWGGKVTPGGERDFKRMVSR